MVHSYAFAHSFLYLQFSHHTYLTPWNYAYQMGIKAADDSKAASQLILKQREYPGLFRWLQYHQLNAGERM